MRMSLRRIYPKRLILYVHNGQSFGNGARVIIRHRVQGGQQPGYPAGSDTVTYRYSY